MVSRHRPSPSPFPPAQAVGALPGGRHGSLQWSPEHLDREAAGDRSAPSNGANAEIQPRRVPLQREVTWNGVVLDVSAGTLSPAGVKQVPPVCPAMSPPDGNKALF